MGGQCSIFLISANKILEREQKLITWVRSEEFSLDGLAEMRKIEH